MPYTVEQLKAGLLADDFPAVCKFIAEHASEFRDAVESDREFVFSENEAAFLEAHPERLGQVYELLGAGDDDDIEERSDLAQALAHSRSNADREIGEAFQALVDNLPERLRSWEEVFGPLKRQVTENVRTYLLHEPSVKYGGKHAVELTQYGLTPTTFHDSTVAVQLLLDRVERMSRNGVPDEFAPRETNAAAGALFAQFSDDRLALIGPPYFVAQLQGVRDMPFEAARPLMGWLLNTSYVFPYLFDGYRVDERADGKGLTFVREPLAYELGLEPELLRQWTRRRPTEEVARRASFRR